MTPQSKFLGVVAVVFSLLVTYRVAPGAAIIGLVLLLVLVHFACRTMWRR